MVLLLLDRENLVKTDPLISFWNWVYCYSAFCWRLKHTSNWAAKDCIWSSISWKPYSKDIRVPFSTPCISVLSTSQIYSHIFMSFVSELSKILQLYRESNRFISELPKGENSFTILMSEMTFLLSLIIQISEPAELFVFLPLDWNYWTLKLSGWRIYVGSLYWILGASRFMSKLIIYISNLLTLK